MDKRKLLIADDSELNRAILANMLEQDYDIIEVTGGEGDPCRFADLSRRDIRTAA